MRRLLRLLAGVLVMLALLVVGYPLAAWVGSSIPESGSAAPPAPDAETIEIMVETNGTHTSIVVPIVSHAKDWRESFPSASRPRRDGHVPTHLSIGWGEREVFLNVPTWGDLDAGTALRIATVGGDPLVRVSHYVRPGASENHRPLSISMDQYRTLVSAIERTLPDVPPGETREILRGTYVDDAYYEAEGSYSLTNTCNTWVGDTLAEAGVEMGMWTPFAGGVMKWIPLPETNP
ncbi:DUF2459 domain-containing protein [Aurantiacibacter gilvus]|uniref:DUF2459 domain-containing protein n=1 Tax=Aurantiacibacter gilvus TaxID=3139141 RepID=A0ABU9IDI1_9SPHN